MDPLGFSLENFDGLGKWRTMSDGVEIDASASLPDGTQFEGVEDCGNFCWATAGFRRTLTEKMLAYAVGRSVEYYDLPVVRQITRNAAPTDYRWSAVILGIVKSAPFTMGAIRSIDDHFEASDFPADGPAGAGRPWRCHCWTAWCRR